MSSQADKAPKSDKKQKQNSQTSKSVGNSGQPTKEEIARRQMQAAYDKKLHLLTQVALHHKTNKAPYSAKAQTRESRKGLRGRGDYWDKLKELGKDFGETSTLSRLKHIWSHPGSFTPAEVVKEVQRGAKSKENFEKAMALKTDIVSKHHKLSKHPLVNRLMGEGDYEVINGQGIHPERTIHEQHTIIDGVPTVSTNKFGLARTIIQHCEMLGEVKASENFSSYKYPINPGMSNTFPWLAPIANQYQQYKMLACVFEFKSMATSYSQDTSLGQLVFATNYNPDAEYFEDMRTMCNSQFSVSCNQGQTMRHAIECKPTDTTIPVKFVRHTVPTDATGQDISKAQYDLGFVQFATEGFPSAAAGDLIGQIWITYEVEVLKPIPEVTSLGQTDYVWNTDTAGGQAPLYGAVHNTTHIPVTTVGTKISLNATGCHMIPVYDAVRSSILFPEDSTNGIFQLNFFRYLASGATANTTFADVDMVNFNCVNSHIMNNYSTDLFQGYASNARSSATGELVASIMIFVKVDSFPASIQIGAGNAGLSFSSTDFTISRLSASSYYRTGVALFEKAIAEKAREIEIPEFDANTLAALKREDLDQYLPELKENENEDSETSSIVPLDKDDELQQSTLFTNSKGEIKNKELLRQAVEALQSAPTTTSSLFSKIVGSK